MKLQKELSDILDKYRGEKSNYSVLKAEFDLKMNGIDEVYNQNLQRLQKKLDSEIKYTQDSVEKIVNKFQPKFDSINLMDKRVKSNEDSMEEVNKNMKEMKL